MTKKILPALLTVLAVLIAHTCKAEPAQKIKIVTTTSQIGDLVKNITQDTADVQYLMGSGIDPHLYHPTRQDVAKLLSADIVVYNGMNLEGKMEKLLKDISKNQTSLSIASILSLDSLNPLEGEEGYDPHIWMNVEHWIIAADEITKIITKQYPEYSETYKVNNTEYKKRLLDLHEYAQNIVNSIPQDKRTLITAHDAFGYLGSAYGLNVIGIQGISTESEAGLTQIETLVDLLVTQKIPAVFVETSVSDHNIKAIIEGAKARGHNVVLGGSLYSDAMGKEGTQEGTYIGMMVYNLKTISKALGGKTSLGSDPKILKGEERKINEDATKTSKDKL
ncbi:MAG: metal ABC transporter solute-binding protein, Zn/Mn family [Alphaproteobacteria bacterium]